jgi:TonB family protein
LPEATRVRLEGDLAGRVWLQAPALTDVTHSNILTDTVLRLTVHPEGWVWSAVLLRGSGLASADRQALDQVRRARLRPGAPGPASAAAGWGWGRMVVLWHTRAPEPVTRAAVPPGP